MDAVPPRSTYIHCGSLAALSHRVVVRPSGTEPKLKAYLEVVVPFSGPADRARGEEVLTALRKLGPTHRGYVERANFVVLRSPDVPSILVETAFITNPSEEAKLKNPDHREKLASAILDGVNGYFRASPPPGSLFAANNAQPSRHQASLTSRYVVNRGDTIRSIAEHHGLSIAQLREANGLDEDRVRPGEILQIPSG